MKILFNIFQNSRQLDIKHSEKRYSITLNLINMVKIHTKRNTLLKADMLQHYHPHKYLTYTKMGQ